MVKVVTGTLICTDAITFGEYAMKTHYRVGLYFDIEMVKTVEAVFKMKVKEGPDAFVIEDSDVWEKNKELIEKWGALVIKESVFTEEELASAKRLAMCSRWRFGYPMPKTNFGYIDNTFDLSRYCRKCGIEAIQLSDFRIIKGPKWGKGDIFTLNWIGEEFFTSVDTYHSVFEPFGVAARTVQNRRGVDTIDGVVQLVVQESVDIDVEGLDSSVCEHCGRTKYLFSHVGYFPRVESTMYGHMVKTNQKFGDGGEADSYVLISQELYQAAKGLKGLGFIPLNDEF